MEGLDMDGGRGGGGSRYDRGIINSRAVNVVVLCVATNIPVAVKIVDQFPSRVNTGLINA